MRKVDMLFMKVLSLIPGEHNLCRDWRCFWFLLHMKPLLLISNAVIVVLKSVMSVAKWAYLFCLNICLSSIFLSMWQVSSNMCNSFFLSRMTISGFRLVTQISGGIVPPPAASSPGKSLNTENFVVSRLSMMYFNTLLCVQVHRPVSSPTLQIFRQ